MPNDSAPDPGQPKPMEAEPTRLRQNKRKLLSHLHLAHNALPGSLALFHSRRRHPGCHCAQGKGHPGWQLTFMVAGKKRVERIPAERADEVKARVEAGRASKEAVDEIPIARRAPFSADDFLFLPVRASHRFVRVRDIQTIRAEGNYTRVDLAGGDSALVLRPLRKWEERLPDRVFVRVHRSVLVNLDHVTRIEGAGGSSYLVHVQGRPEPLPMSRRFTARILERLG